MRLTEWFHHIFCRHRYVEFCRNIYGDEINQHSTVFIYRSWWRCLRCGAIILSRDLVTDPKPVIRDRTKREAK